MPPILFRDIPDETLDMIFQYAKERPYPWNGDRVEREGAFFSETLPVPTTLLSLRLVSKRCFKIATRYTWEMVDVYVKHTDPYVEQLEIRCRKTFSIIEFFVSNPHLARLIRILKLRLAALESKWSSAGLLHIQSTLKKFFRLTTSLTVCVIHGADVLTLAAPNLFSITSLRVFVDLTNGPTQAFTSLDGVRNLDLSHLEAIYANEPWAMPLLLSLPLTLKSLYLMSTFESQIRSQSVPELLLPSILLSVEEFEFVPDCTAVSKYICKSFAVCIQHRCKSTWLMHIQRTSVQQVGK